MAHFDISMDSTITPIRSNFSPLSSNHPVKEGSEVGGVNARGPFSLQNIASVEAMHSITSSSEIRIPTTLDASMHQFLPQFPTNILAQIDMITSNASYFFEKHNEPTEPKESARISALTLDVFMPLSNTTKKITNSSFPVMEDPTYQIALEQIDKVILDAGLFMTEFTNQQKKRFKKVNSNSISKEGRKRTAGKKGKEDEKIELGEPKQPLNKKRKGRKSSDPELAKSTESLVD